MLETLCSSCAYQYGCDYHDIYMRFYGIYTCPFYFNSAEINRPTIINTKEGEKDE